MGGAESGARLDLNGARGSDLLQISETGEFKTLEPKLPACFKTLRGL